MNIIKLYIIFFSVLNCLLLSIYGNMNIVKQLISFRNQFLPEECRNTNFSIEDLQRLFRAKCEKASNFSDNTELYQGLEKAASQLVVCFDDLFNVTTIQKEINDALPIGELDTVFHKYCAKVPYAEECFHDFNEVIQSCLTQNEQDQNHIMLHLVSGLMGFICTKGGNHLALFFAEEGFECLEESKDHIARCANESLNELFSSNLVKPNLADLYELILQPELCKSLKEFKDCTLHQLEQCREITSANLAESIFRYIKNSTSCKDWMDNQTHKKTVWRQSNNNSSIATTSVLPSVLISTFVSIIYYVYGIS